MRKLRVVALVLLAVMLTSTVALAAAAYRASYTVTETSSNDYTMIAVIADANNTWMADNGFMSSTALDTRVQNLGGMTYPHLVVDDSTLAALPVAADSQTNLFFTTGNTAATSMEMMTGVGGYITTSDDADLEMGNQFEVALDDAYIDTGAGASKNILIKSGAFQFYVSSAGNITAQLLGTGSANTTPTSTNDPSTAWTNDGNAIDDNTGTYANTTADIGATSWSSYLEMPHAALDTIGVRIWCYVVGASAPHVNIDAYYDGGWNTVVADSAFTAGTWNEFYMSGGVQSVTNIRARLYNNAGVSEEGRIYEIDYIEGVTVTDAVATGEHDLVVTADTTDLKLTVDSVLQDSDSLGSASVPDNANDYVWGQNDVLTYFTSATLDTGGAEKLWYQPVAIISGTTLPDRQATGGSENGAITWGSNPAGVAATLGSLSSIGQSVAAQTTTAPTKDLLPEVPVDNAFQEPDVSGALLTNPLRPLITMVSDNTMLTETQVWLYFGLFVVVIAVAASIAAVPKHLAVAGFAGGAASLGMVAMTVWPLYGLILVALLVVGGLVAERSPSL